MGMGMESPIHPSNGDVHNVKPASDTQTTVKNTPEAEAEGSHPIDTNTNHVDVDVDVDVDVATTSGSKSNTTTTNNNNNNNNNAVVVVRRERPTRACTARPAKYVDPPVIERRPRPRPRPPKKEEEVEEEEEEEVEEEDEDGKEQCSKIVTPLLIPPTADQLPRWNLRSMWELASILNFLHVFREVLKITVEFSAEELESALLYPNTTLSDIHIPLLKAIPPVTRMACGHETWVTVLCRKLRDWWHWVAEGELPIVANHGAENDMYKTLDPRVRVVILKALCDIRVEQDDIRSYIDSSLKHGAQLSAFRKERIGGDSHGISFWYEDDELVGHRLYREIRKVEKKVEVKKGKIKGSNVLPSTTYEWEAVATNLDEFLDVSEKLFSSKNRTEASLGKKLKIDKLPEIEKVHKRKEKLVKKQQRQALLLDNCVNMDGLAGGRSLRDRKHVTYTFDDFDRSINEAIKVTKRKQPSPEPGCRRETAKPEASDNGRLNSSSHALNVSFSPPSPVDYDEMDADLNSESLDRSNRRRQRPQRYSEKEFVEAISDNEQVYFDSDDDIVGEAVYDDEYMQQRKQKKRLTSSSDGEGDEEYNWSEENGEDEVEEEEEDSLSVSEDSDQPRGRFKKPEGRTRRGAKIRSVDDLDSGLRRSKRATRNRIDYRQYEMSESETETFLKHGKANAASERHYDATDNLDYSMESQDSDEGNEERAVDESTPMVVDKGENGPVTKSESPKQDDSEETGAARGFLDLNELAPGSGFDDGPSALAKDEDQKGE